MKKISLVKRARKEIEKWLNIPHIIKMNKVLINELKISNELNDDLLNKLDFSELNRNKLNDQVMKLKRERDDKIEQKI